MNTRIVMINNDVASIAPDRQPFGHFRQDWAYRRFYALCHEMGLPIEYCSPYDFDLESGLLRGWWSLAGGVWRPVPVMFRPDCVFDKASGCDFYSNAVMHYCENAGMTIFGPRDLHRLTGDKWHIYQQFPQFQPLSILLPRDRSELVDALYDFFRQMDETYAEHDNKAVAKPLYGFQARGIHVISRKPHGLEMHMLFGGQIHGLDIERNLDEMVRTPYLLQAWVDTGAGLPEVGLPGERHDVRFVFRIKEPHIAKFEVLYIKTVHGMIYVPLEKFGPDPFEVVNPIAEWIASHFDRGIFSVDVMRDASGAWFLTELNDQVGLTMEPSDPDDVAGVTHLMRVYIEEMLRAF